MDAPEITGEPPSKDGGAEDTDRAWPHGELEGRVAAGILDLVKNCFYMHAVDITEVRFLKRDDAWLVIIKGRKSGQKLVAFFNARRFQDALVEAVTSADTKKVDWKEDRPPPWARC